MRASTTGTSHALLLTRKRAARLEDDGCAVLCCVVVEPTIRSGASSSENASLAPSAAEGLAKLDRTISDLAANNSNNLKAALATTAPRAHPVTRLTIVIE